MAVGVQLREFDVGAYDNASTTALLDGTLGRLIDPIKAILSQNEVVDFKLGASVFGMEHNYKPTDPDSEGSRTLHVRYCAGRSFPEVRREDDFPFGCDSFKTLRERRSSILGAEVPLDARKIGAGYCDKGRSRSPGHRRLRGFPRTTLRGRRRHQAMAFTSPPTVAWNGLPQMIATRHGPGVEKPVPFEVLGLGLRGFARSDVPAVLR